MANVIHHTGRALTPYPRCFYLFFMLVAMLVLLPFLAESRFGMEMSVLFEFLIMAGAIVALGRSYRMRVIGVLLAVPAVGLRLLAVLHGMEAYFLLAKGATLIFYGFILYHLMKYVFHPDVLSKDKLYGAASAYLLLALAWANLYILLQYFFPGAFAINGTATVLDMKEVLYFSFSVITTAGFGDITASLFQSRCFVMLEATTGVLYVAILIARLAGSYQPEERSKP